MSNERAIPKTTGAVRDAKGRFQAGTKMGGRKPLAPELRDALLPLGYKAVRALNKILDDPQAKDADKLRAVDIVLERLLGKAAQPILAEIHQDAEPMTLSQMMERARELLGDG